MSGVVIGTLCLNEMQWLPKLYEQHKDWPGLKKWVFVESADVMYSQANPNLVSNGLSVDGTTEWLEDLAKQDDRVVHVKHGFSSHRVVDQGKCGSRQRYMEEGNLISPDYLVTLDADEFYTHADQAKIHQLMEKLRPSKYHGIIIPYRNIWHPPSIADQKLFKWEIVGKFWRIKVCKLWQWYPGIRYSGNHNSPEVNGILSNTKLQVFDNVPSSPEFNALSPEFIHMGFAADPTYRIAKNRYYIERGEGVTDRRQSHVDSREAFETWKPGDSLANRDKIVDYDGPIPEVFQNGK